MMTTFHRIKITDRDGSLKESHPNIIIFTNEKCSGTPYDMYPRT